MVDKKKGRNLLRNKAIAYAVVVVATIILITFNIYYIQTVGQQEYQKTSSLEPLLEEVMNELDTNASYVQTLTNRFHNANQSTLQMIELLLRSGCFKELQEATDILDAAQALKNLSQNTGMYSMFIFTQYGDLVLMDKLEFYEAGLMDMQYNLMRTENNPAGVFSTDEFQRLTARTGGWDGTVYTSGTTAECKPVYTVIEDSAGNIYNGYYYSTAIKTEDGSKSGYYLVAMADASELDAEISGLKNIESILTNMGVGKTGFVFSLSPETGEFLYFENAEGLNLTGEKYAESGITDDVLVDGYSGIQIIDGVEYFCVTKVYSSEVFGDYVVIAASVPEVELYASRTSNVLWSVLIFIIVGSLIILQIDQYKKGTINESRRLLFRTKSGNEIYYNRALGLRIMPLLVVGLVTIFAVSMFSQTLTQLSIAVTASDTRIEEIGINIEKNRETAETIRNFYDKQNLYKAMLIADILERDPDVAFSYDDQDSYHYELAKDTDNSTVLDDYGNPIRTGRFLPSLQAIADSNGISSIYVFNDQGRVIATNRQWWNFVLSDDPNDQSYEFRDVILNSDSLIQEAQISDVGESEQFIGSVYYYYTYDDNGTTRFASSYEYTNGIKDENGNILVPASGITRHRSLVQVGITSEMLEDVLKIETMEYVLDGMRMFYDGSFIVFDSNEEHTLLYSAFSETTIDSIKSDGMFTGTFNGYRTIEGVRSFITLKKVGDLYIGTIMPGTTLFRLRNIVAIITVGLSLISFLNLLGFMLYSSSDQDDAMKMRLEEEQAAESENMLEGSANFDVKMPDGQTKRVKAVNARWRQRFTEWEKKSVEQKFSFITAGFGFLFFLAVLFVIVFSRYLFSRESILSYIISGDLERTPNMFVFTRCLVLLIVAMFGTRILQRVIHILTVNLGARAETVGHLLESVLKYGSVIGILFYMLHLIGFNTASLITSASLLSLVVGFGAQSLISDILAGIFIVFEGEFRVGDIVTIGDFRGTVIEIGIRTTKIEDFVGNIKILNNSSISGVLNMTKEYSTVAVTLSIEYGESLERVESVLKKQFPIIREGIPEIVNGPFYKGVSSMGDNSVNLLVVAQCLEGDRMGVMRALNRELYLTFTENGINIPFPQVTISYLEDKKTKGATKKEKKEAKGFVKGQRDKSKRIESVKNS